MSESAPRFVEGDVVVHKNYGVGEIISVPGSSPQTAKDLSVTSTRKVTTKPQLKATQGLLVDAIKLKFSDGDVFVPLDQINVLTLYCKASDKDTKKSLKYSSIKDNTKWRDTLEKATKYAREDATALLQRMAEQQLERSEPLQPISDDLQTAIDTGFEFTETVDQQAAIDTVFRDLQSTRPMRRIIFGDVGFGKTEVALRAAMVVAENGKQTVFLAPSSVLAGQHFNEFYARFSGTDYKVALLTSGTSPSERAEIVTGLANGAVSVLVGTQSVLNENLNFKALSLIIIDEEQRLGVGQKQTVPDRYRGLNVLLMSATTIPRTTALSKLGEYDVSVIATPPEGRQPTETSVYVQSNQVVRDAIVPELARQGQVFYIVSEVQQLADTVNYLQQLLADVQVEGVDAYGYPVRREVLMATIHGKMPAKKKDEIINAFMDRQFDILVSTTVVEIGVNIPNANTMIVTNVCQFGLSTLHQLRGRVGRARRQGFCFYLSNAAPKGVCKKRLETLAEHAYLGGGFKISESDLAIRGPGEVFGLTQRGHEYTVGPAMYKTLVQRELRRLMGVLDPDAAADFTPEIIMADVDRRIEGIAGVSKSVVAIQAELARVTRSTEEIDQVANELLTPEMLEAPTVSNLIYFHYIRVLATQLGLRKVEITADSMSCYYLFERRLLRDGSESSENISKIPPDLIDAFIAQTKGLPFGYRRLPNDPAGERGFKFVFSADHRKDVVYTSYLVLKDDILTNVGLVELARPNGYFDYPTENTRVVRVRCPGHFVRYKGTTKLQPAPAGYAIMDA